VEQLAAQVPDSNGVFIVPAFSGLGAPHWDPYARGTIVGITGGITAAHIARATLESIAFQVADLIRAMEDDSEMKIEEVRVDGGASVNDLLLQFQADILGVRVVRPRISETTALGAAYLAGLAVGYWRDRDDIAAHWHTSRSFEPVMDRERMAVLSRLWRKALDCSRGWEAAEPQ
jgi:glycerol kinase